MSKHLSVLPFTCCLLVVGLLAALRTSVSSANQQAPVLTNADKEYLASLLKEVLFDPAGTQRVAVQTGSRTVWRGWMNHKVEGWFVPGINGQQGRIYFTDGTSMQAPAQVEGINFEAVGKRLYAAGAPQQFDATAALVQLPLTGVGAMKTDDVTMAAWLYRSGREDLAARALTVARMRVTAPGMPIPKDVDSILRKNLRQDLAWTAFARMIHSYIVRADLEAQAHAQQLLDYYADIVKDNYPQAPQVALDLKRRQDKGTLGKQPPKGWPDGFAQWDSKKKTAYLVEQLEEVDVTQLPQRVDIDLAADPRIDALIRLGDAAVPDLIDTLEKDERLTRSVYFYRYFARQRTVLSVREAALTALMSILRVQFFEPPVVSGNTPADEAARQLAKRMFTSGGESAAKKMAKRIRDYWAEYGQLPLDERMMKILADPKATFVAKRAAAQNLARLDQDRRLQTTMGPTVVAIAPAGTPNPAVAKFTKPTAAEAILAALDADLKENNSVGVAPQGIPPIPPKPAKDAKVVTPPQDTASYYRQTIEAAYLRALVELGDKRITLELAKRAAAPESQRMQRQWAEAASYLGDPQPLDTFADDFKAGKVTLPAGQGAGTELHRIVGALISADTAKSNQALFALANPKHPQYENVQQAVLKLSTKDYEQRVWFSHPFSLRILRRALDDTKISTSVIYSIDKGVMERKEGRMSVVDPIPEFLADPAVRRNKEAERRCDAAAEKLSELVLGVPKFHLLFKDADIRLKTIKTTFDKYRGNYRRLTPLECEKLDIPMFPAAFVPDLPALGHGATAEDVAAGRAIFTLDEKGKPAPLKLAATAVWKADKNEKPTRLLILQAEVGPDGEMTYGIVIREEVKQVPGRELTNIKSIAEADKKK